MIKKGRRGKNKNREKGKLVEREKKEEEVKDKLEEKEKRKKKVNEKIRKRSGISGGRKRRKRYEQLNKRKIII